VVAEYRELALADLAFDHAVALNRIRSLEEDVVRTASSPSRR
jgi:hypothetical protein